MSSRLLLPDDPRRVAPVVWPTIHAVESPAATAPEPSMEAAALERQFEEKLRATRTAALREGEAAGQRRAAAELEPVLERFAATVADLAAMRANLRRQAEADMLQLALAIARRVLRRELAVDPEALHGLVLGALEKLEGQEISRVRVHPSYASAVAELLRRPGGSAAVEVIPDGACEPGGALFETARGTLDASVETQLQEIERGLADCLRRRA